MSTRLPSIRSRSVKAPKKAGVALVGIKDIEPLQSQLERLQRAFQRCDDAARIEVLIVAEVLAGATP
jgi:hypothetical protein